MFYDNMVIWLKINSQNMPLESWNFDTLNTENNNWPQEGTKEFSPIQVTPEEKEHQEKDEFFDTVEAEWELEYWENWEDEFEKRGYMYDSLSVEDMKAIFKNEELSEDNTKILTFSELKDVYMKDLDPQWTWVHLRKILKEISQNTWKENIIYMESMSDPFPEFWINIYAGWYGAIRSEYWVATENGFSQRKEDVNKYYMNN